MALALAAAIGACRGARPFRPTVPPPAATVAVGSCAHPERDGVVARGQLRRADRDLNGDRRAEPVVADRSLCSAEGNCYWNLFAADAASGCHRYLGTVAAAALEALEERGDDGFRDLHGLWRLTGPSRVLLQRYRYVRGGYQVVDALVCGQKGDDRLECTGQPR